MMDMESQREKAIPRAVKIAKLKRGRMGLVTSDAKPMTVVRAESITARKTLLKPSQIASIWSFFSNSRPSRAHLLLISSTAM